MDFQGGERRPPRSARPGYAPQPTSSPGSPISPFNEQSAYQGRPPHAPTDAPGSRPNVSFQNVERGERRKALDAQERQRGAAPTYQNNQLGGGNTDLEEFDPGRVGRKKSLVRPDREKIEPGHRQWHYRTAVAQIEEDGGSKRLDVLPSTTGNAPRSGDLRRGRSLLGREQDVHESGLSLFKRSTMRRKRSSNNSQLPILPPEPAKKRGCLGDFAPGPKGPWMVYCFLITCWIPTVLMRSCGLRTREQQRAWREKIGLMSIIAILMAGVGFLTFGFTEAVCGTPQNRYHGGAVGEAFIGKGSVTRNGYDYDLSDWHHPTAGSTFDGTTNPLLTGDWNVAGNDISFLFQTVNQQCLGLITKSANSSITGDGTFLDWYFPCNIIDQWGKSPVNMNGYESAKNCHTSSTAKTDFSALTAQGQVYLTWDDIKNSGRNLAVYQSSVLDLSLLNWLSTAQVSYPAIFDEMKVQNGKYSTKDITMHMVRTKQDHIARCLEDTVRVGFIDTSSIGCVASEVVLIVSLVFIIGVVAIRFVMAVMFAWFFSRKMGNFPHETYEQRMQRSAEIENWSNDIYRAAPSEYRPNVGKGGLKLTKGQKRNTNILPNTSRFTPSEHMLKGAGGRPTTAYGMLDSSSTLNYKRATAYSTAKGSKGSPPDTPGSYRHSRATMFEGGSRTSFNENPCPFPLHNVVPQPPPDYEPFNFPLAHTIALVTAYSESFEGLRTTLDSLATTDYPNSHKLILVIADGLVKGEGNNLTTPEICISMMKDFVIQPQDVEPHSYVAIADGHKRHNMAKVYAGFYDYDDATVERSKQQRVPIVLVAKCGNPLEINDSKPGNRGKRDSQIVLMAFLQKVMFDERMTTFEYEFFNSIWRVTGVSPDRYEMVLCVDADTKVFPDSLSRMVACMVNDEEIMGLCGETKIANKADTFVTMMQVFEYYISHHMTKAFESMFGGVTCLPGCFSMYRIKAPKGDSGYWVPILANPDIVEHYSENVVDTLHKKNLLLLGEDRYLTTLLLKTFPKRKNMFCPAAVCKTIVPDTFRVLLSQRRRWINSTIHNLSELVLVRDLCGTFCFSMQFVVGMELAGTLVLPAAIAFTLYLIIVSIIPGGTNTTIPLVLLAVVLGLPGLLIVITSRKIAYVGWMIVYLISLPIWNGILPAYSFWHFDDFSWGQTRKLDGGDKDGLHGDKDGEFDSSHIVMKKWAEFERERRWKSGTQSRDSVYYDRNNRNSLASNSDLTHPASGGFDSSTVESASVFSGPTPRSRPESTNLLNLPAPLGGNRQLMSSGSSAGLSRSSDDTSDNASHSHQRLVGSPQSDPYASDPYEDVPPAVKAPRPTRSGQPPFMDNQHNNPFTQSAATSPISYDSPTDTDNTPASRGRGVSLTDSGPVPSAEGGVRRVAARGRRQSQQASPQNRYSRNSAVFALPPGAAPPSTGYGQ